MSIISSTIGRFSFKNNQEPAKDTEAYLKRIDARCGRAWWTIAGCLFVASFMLTTAYGFVPSDPDEAEKATVKLLSSFQPTPAEYPKNLYLAESDTSSSDAMFADLASVEELRSMVQGQLDSLNNGDGLMGGMKYTPWNASGNVLVTDGNNISHIELDNAHFMYAGIRFNRGTHQYTATWVGLFYKTGMFSDWQYADYVMQSGFVSGMWTEEKGSYTADRITDLRLLGLTNAEKLSEVLK